MEKKETLKGFILFSNCSALKTMMLIDDTKEKYKILAKNGTLAIDEKSNLQHFAKKKSSSSSKIKYFL